MLPTNGVISDKNKEILKFKPMLFTDFALTTKLKSSSSSKASFQVIVIQLKTHRNG